MRAVVVVPSYNGRHLLETCLSALCAQTFRDYETIVVDDGSTDDTVSWLGVHFPEVRVVAQPVNRGFVAAVNAAITATESELVVLLNNDTEPEPGWLSALVAALDAHPQAGMAASKLLVFDRRDHLHSAGDYYTLAGLPGNRGVWERDVGQYDADRWIFGACGGAAAYRRSLLREVGAFDEALGMYCEDVDLAFRAQLAGHGCVFAPDARVYHRISATSGDRASYYCGRNFIAIVAKDYPADLLRRHWPRVVGAQLQLAIDAARHWREPAARARLWGQLHGLLQLPRFLAARRAVQSRRRASTTYLEALLTGTTGTLTRPDASV